MLPPSPISILNKNSGTQNRYAKFIICTKSLGSMENVRCMHQDNCTVEEWIYTAQLGRINITFFFFLFFDCNISSCHTIYRPNNGEKKLLLEKGPLKRGYTFEFENFLVEYRNPKANDKQKIKGFSILIVIA